ncbi:vitelline membrane outer layer protein 1-like [Heteronotia binoei]|uniref:vitelline membrane outer layer protein 1-like n=1 Tax=Heteronotia binoei TaxID=13085 RepID=UPI00292E900C|nr:vitelline membrane outer layer protein 1-like [Heteronotia binoei]
MQVTTTTAVSFLLSCYLWVVEPRDTTSTLTVPNGWSGSIWGPKQVCASGYAQKFSLKVEPYQGIWRDDTSLNGIRLYCSDGSIISSAEGEYGTWSKEESCKSGFLNSFSLRVSAREPINDNTAAENVKFKCTDGRELEGSGHAWGEYAAWSESCQEGGICGIQTKVDIVPRYNAVDPTGLENVRFFCCS